MPLHVSTVVVPIDFSVASNGAIETALEIVDSPSQIHLIHVMLPLETMSPGVLLGDITDVAVMIGTPGLEIADYAKRHKADLILIPSHGYHGMKRLFLGSVAERVLRHAPCRVLVLRRTDNQ